MEPLGKILEGILRNPGFRERLLAWRVLSEWEEVVGQEVASRAWPVSFSHGRLKVGVSDPVWASALRFEVPRILDLLNRRAGKKLFREIRFEVGSPPRNRPRLSRLRSLSPEEEKRIEDSVRHLEDPELREIFRAWRRVLARAGNPDE
ncbi:MAG TPA: DUF721 domain-containing protein [Thermosulfurimonas dismutans]|uniref:DUF721 domain-containing protein n=1 Tax=Thermosulfurimonas dismutans TaxID=999894 RepID=A0A7C3CXC4_9BACT|nr:DUF721 domain-containing protein [Thermosulfurimonas dismutans]